MDKPVRKIKHKQILDFYDSKRAIEKKRKIKAK